MAASKSADTSTGFDKTIDRVRDNVKAFASTAGETVSDGVADLADGGADGIKSVAHSVAGAVPNVSGWLDEQVDMVRERIRAEPVKMAAIAAGVGALIGAMFLRR
jgi:ElaB/YqjD/DUF883 family membrane-anchored ribosome-binding protein